MSREASRYTLRMSAIPEAQAGEEVRHGYDTGSSREDEKSEKAPSENNSTYFDDPNWDEDAFEYEDDSPYPEVRSAVANTDDPLMPVSTVRAWFIGIIWAMLIPGLNQFFIFRYPSINVTGTVALLISYPLGRFLAHYVPRNWTLFGLELNPGPFSIKEHVLITVMASVGAPSAYAVDIVTVQRVFYGQVYNFSYQWFLVMSTQFIGFSIGGLARRILVDPPSMIWPSNLVTCALFNTLHSEHYTGVGDRGGVSREKYFWCAFACSFAWYFFPGYLFQALSYFSWVTWIWPENTTVAQLFGYVNGLGFSILTFDWNQIAYIGSPLATPWWAQVNVIIGFVFFYWIITPILHFKNVWYGEYMPILSSSSYDNKLETYDVSRILTSDSMQLDVQAYEQYSPLFLSTTFALSYGLSFATITATLSHAFIYYRKQIWSQARRSLREQPDVHARLMARYPQVPDWWYYTIFVIFFILGVISIELWPTEMPVWALVLALAIAMIYAVPVGIVQAITNHPIALNVVTELIIGYVLPGRPIAMMMFKTWGYISMAQAMTFTSDMKLGHYMKIPPRPMFWAQVVGTLLAGTSQLGVQVWMFHNVPKMCEIDQPDGFVCPHTRVFGVSSIIWGVIGPSRMFSKGSTYYPLVYFFLIGAIGPFIPWIISKRYPNSFMKYIHLPIVFAGTNLLPPATAINFVPWAIVGFFFQYLLRRRHFSWWTKYNYVLSAALDSGVAVSVIVIYFALQYPKNGTIGLGTIQKWWGNTIPFTGADGRGTPIRALAPGETFGPSTW